VPAGHQRTGTQWRAIAGFSLNIGLLGDFEHIIHFDVQITDDTFQLPVARQAFQGRFLSDQFALVPGGMFLRAMR
jgi:hypothetical protein